MSDKVGSRDILNMIKNQRITPEEGLRMLERQFETVAVNEELQISQESSQTIYYQSVWEESTKVRTYPNGTFPACVLMLNNEDIRSDLKKHSEAWNKSRIILVKPGRCFEDLGNDIYQVNPLSVEENIKLIKELSGKKIPIERIFHMCSQGSLTNGMENLERDTQNGIQSLLCLSKAVLVSKLSNIIRLSYIYPVNNRQIQPQFAAVKGFNKTIRLENPNLIFKAAGINISESNQFIQQISMVLETELLSEDLQDEVYYDENRRFVRKLKEINPDAFDTQSLPLKENGVYLITGGLGGLGLIFAEYLAERVKARMVLIGRSGINFESNARLKELENLGSEVAYIQADISKKDDVERVITESRQRFGTINGIIHCAGIIRDRLVINKTIEEMKEVIAPKVFGCIWLDEFTREDKLDVFICFSSAASEFGNIGQSDYAYGNGFMDYFVEEREHLRESGKRSGKTVSINWPLWKDGGMVQDENAKELLYKQTGIVPLSTKNGIRAFENALVSPVPRILVLEGDMEKIRGVFGNEKLKQSNGVDGMTVLTHQASFDNAAQSQAVSAYYSDEPDKSKIQSMAEDFLKEILSHEIKLPAFRIVAREPFEKYGIDSIKVMSLTRKLEKHFGELSKTLFFEYQTIEELAGYFVENYRDRITGIKGGISQQNEEPGSKGNADIRENYNVSGQRFTDNGGLRRESKIHTDKEEIAIVGVSGRYPMADNLDELWENLKSGRDCITEIPGDRWDYRDYYEPGRSKPGKSNSKWGGFMKDMDKFDPLFFNISPKEASFLDPQERLFLETAWHTVEDAGYTRKKLSGEKVGIFVGVMYGHYQLFGAEENIIGNNIVPSASYASIANRVSYYFNFNGPSIALDTMCSSSLTAIHLACSSIRNGDCNFAIAGGVNVTCHPYKYLQLGIGNFASSNGRCRSFGEGGDGYVPGEGVGAVFLKPLGRAIEDGDYIYAVIKGTSVNHGGKTNGYTVPNPNAQAELIADALGKSGVDPAVISCIEAHGSGTSLGDPIEITGLVKAFRTFTKETQYCSIGSIKSNIGHLESAAGIAGITKVLLQMKYKTLVPSIHSEKLNPNINFMGTPFYVQRNLTEWKQPVIRVDGEEKKISRIAGVSSFGAGGANAHIILEEYENTISANRIQETRPQIIVLSARNEERLKEYAQKIAGFLEEEASGDNFKWEQNGNIPVKTSLEDIAYILQNCREEMEERLAIVSTGREDVVRKLNQYALGETGIEGVYCGKAVKGQSKFNILEGDEDARDIIARWVEKGKVSKLAELWVNGIDLDWRQLHLDSGHKKVKIPNYPFAREKYWIERKSEAGFKLSNTIHKLIDSLDTNLSLKNKCIVYEKTFTASDPVIKEHRIKGQPILPGAAYLEIVCAAASQAGYRPDLSVSRIIWMQPVALIDDKVTIRIIMKEHENKLTFEIQSGKNTSTNSHFKCELYTDGRSSGSVADVLPFERLKAGSSFQLAGEEFYKRFESIDIAYGSYFRTLNHIWGDNGEVLAKLELSQEFAKETEQYILHPALSDGAFQTIACVTANTEIVNGQPLLPFSIERVEIIKPLKAEAYVYTKSAGRNKYDITIADKDGTVCVKFHEVLVRAAGNSSEELKMSGQGLLYYPDWKEVPSHNRAKEYSGTLEGLENKQRTVLVVRSEQLEIDKGIKDYYGKDYVIDILLGDENRKHPSGSWEVKTGDYNFMESIIRQVENIDTIYFLGGIQLQDFSGDDFDGLEQSQERGALSMLRLVKALSSNGYRQKKLEIKVIANNIYSINKKEKIRPYSASLFGMAKSAAKEYSNWDIQCIDVPTEDIRESLSRGELYGFLKLMLNGLDYPNGEELVFRDGKCYMRTIYPMNITREQGISFKQNGVYLIVGGAGGIGLEFGKYLVETVTARLVLVGRRQLNEEQLEKIHQMESKGGKILYIRVDAADPDNMEKAIAEAKSHFGEINGAIHSAMVLKDKTIDNMDEEAFYAAINPKIKGSMALYKALQGENLDFMMFFSSTVTFTGNVGQSNYAAGCAFEDAFANYLNQKAGYPVIAINWGYWGSVGVAASERYRKQITSFGFGSIESGEGIDAVKKILKSGVRQAIVIKADKKLLGLIGVDFTQQIEVNQENNIPLLKAGKASEYYETEHTLQEKTEVRKYSTSKGNFAHDLEQTLLEIISTATGISTHKILIEKDFSEYGIDSIIGADLVVKINDALGIMLKTSAALDYPSVKKLANFIYTQYRAQMLENAKSANYKTEDRKDSVKVYSVHDLEQTLLEIISAATGISTHKISIEKDFSEYGIDSVIGVDLIGKINDTLGIILKTSAALDYPSVKRLADFIYTQYGAQMLENAKLVNYNEAKPVKHLENHTNKIQKLLTFQKAVKLPPEILPLNTEGHYQNSFWVHGGTGLAGVYNSLAKSLGSDYPFYAFQARGVDSRTIPHEFHEMVSHYIHCMRLIQPEGPYFIGGYSYGGIVAYEIAQQLCSMGESISHLVMVDTFPITAEVNEIMTAKGDYFKNLIMILVGNNFANTKGAGKPLVTLKDIEGIPAELKAAQIARLAKQRGKSQLSEDGIYNYIKGVNTIFNYVESAVTSYKPLLYTGSDVLYFKSNKGLLTGDSWFSNEPIDLFGNYDYSKPWLGFIKKKLSVVEVPSDHFDILEGASLEIVAKHIKAVLKPVNKL